MVLLQKLQCPQSLLTPGPCSGFGEFSSCQGVFVDRYRGICSLCSDGSRSSMVMGLTEG